MKKLIVGFLFGLLLAGCGGDETIVSPGAGSAGGGGNGGGGTTTVSLAMGNGSGAGFQAGAISLGSTSLAAGGSTSLQASLVDVNQANALYAQSVTVNFTSQCVATGLAQINSASVDTATGVATATYVAQGCSGSDVITATAIANNQNLTASGTISVAAAAIGSITFVSATPTNIALKGTGGPGRQETSTVVFKVVDSSGGPRAGATVNFTLDTTVGGISLTPSSATSDASGLVQTVVNAGTVSTTVRITARITDPAISTQSSQLTVTTGIPDTDSFSVAPQCPNVEAFNIDGVEVPVTVRLADRFNNPVPDGTAIAFTAEGGQIQSQCTTTTSTTASGFCTATWTSADPRPQLPSNGIGRVRILATAIGEDSFVDSNANGFYDSGETFADLGEPYRDDDESDTYSVGESFLDFNNNGSRDASDGAFSGVICTGTSPGSTCNLTTTAIGSQTLIVMSTSGANITGLSTHPSGAARVEQLTYNIQDLNGNAMPEGTTIVITASSKAGTIEQPSSFVVPCDAGRGGSNITAYLTTPDAPTGDGVVTVTVTSPGGIITTFRTTIDL